MSQHIHGGLKTEYSKFMHYHKAIHLCTYHVSR